MLHLAPVVVGIDGEEASVAALEFAVQEARLRSTHVRALCCWPAPDNRDGAGQPMCATREQATGILDRVIDEVRRRNPPRVPLMREVSQNLAGPALVTASRHAQLIVLGSTTRGPQGHHHGRRTLEHCLLYAHSPVVVVPWLVAVIGDAGLDVGVAPVRSPE